MATTKNETCIWRLHGNCCFSGVIAHLVGWIFTGGGNEQMGKIGKTMGRGLSIEGRLNTALVVFFNSFYT